MIALASFAAACGDSSDASAGGDSIAAYCKLSEQNELADDFLDGEDFSPEAMEAGFAHMGELLDDALAVVPAEIKDDFKTVAAQFDQLVAGLKEVDYNFMALDPETLAFLTDPELEAASDRLDVWSDENCS